MRTNRRRTLYVRPLRVDWMEYREKCRANMFNMSRENAYEKLHSLKKESDQDRVSHFEMITASQRQSTDRLIDRNGSVVLTKRTDVE